MKAWRMSSPVLPAADTFSSCPKGPSPPPPPPPFAPASPPLCPATAFVPLLLMERRERKLQKFLLLPLCSPSQNRNDYAVSPFRNNSENNTFVFSPLRLPNRCAKKIQHSPLYLIFSLLNCVRTKGSCIFLFFYRVGNSERACLLPRRTIIKKQCPCFALGGRRGKGGN